MIASREYVKDLITKVLRKKDEYLDLTAAEIRPYGNQSVRIHTGINIDDISDPVYEIKINPITIPQFLTFGFTAYRDENTDTFRVIDNSGKFLVYNFVKAGGGGTSIGSYTKGMEMTIIFKQGLLKVNSESYTFSQSPYANHYNSEIIFADGGLSTTAILYYYGKLYDGDKLLMHLIPKRRNSDNVVGFYDLVSKRFFEPPVSCNGRYYGVL